MKSRKEKRGGKRPNAGRRPVADKKVPFYIYIRESLIEKHGGTILLRSKLQGYIDAI